MQALEPRAGQPPDLRDADVIPSPLPVDLLPEAVVLIEISGRQYPL